MLLFIYKYIFFLSSHIVCKERLKSSQYKYLDLIFKEIDDLIVNQNSAIEGLKLQKLFEDRFPYNEFRLHLLTDKQQSQLRKIFYDRKPFS